MGEWIVLVGLGLFISILGIINMTGNISSLHSYHRHRVSEADRKPFGKLVGLGTLIIGIAMIVFGILQLVSQKTNLPILLVIGTVELVGGIVVGLALTFYAMFKYNKGIF